MVVKARPPTCIRPDFGATSGRLGPCRIDIRSSFLYKKIFSPLSLSLNFNVTSLFCLVDALINDHANYPSL